MESDNLVFKENGEISQMKSKNKYDNLKNDYFLKKYLIMLKKRNYLILWNIIKI